MDDVSYFVASICFYIFSEADFDVLTDDMIYGLFFFVLKRTLAVFCV